MSDLKKRGVVKVTSGKFTGDDGKERNRYVIVGDYLATDNSNRQAIKLYATAFSEEKWLNIYIDDEYKTNDKSPMPQSAVIDAIYNKDDVILEDIDDKPIDLSEIPF
jgi:hypothetical protein